MGNKKEIEFNKSLILYIKNAEIECLYESDFNILKMCFKVGISPSTEEKECDIICGDYGIEHFAITSGYENKKGFRQHRLSYEHSKRFKDETIANGKLGFSCKISPHDDKHSLDNLRRSMKKNFNNHYAKLENYKTKHKSIIFFIDCTVGLHLIDQSQRFQPYPAHFDQEILGLISEKEGIEGVFFCTNRHSSNASVCFISMEQIKKNKEELMNKLKNYIVYEGMQFADINFTDTYESPIN